MKQVVEAYLTGLEALAVKGGDISRIAKRGELLRQPHRHRSRQIARRKIARANDPDEKGRLNALKGKIAVANAKLAYQHYLRLFAGERWQALQGKWRQAAAAVVGVDRYQE